MSADKLPSILNATEEDIQLLLAAQAHLGTKNCDKTMEPYVYKRRADGSFFRPFRKSHHKYSYQVSTFLTSARPGRSSSLLPVSSLPSRTPTTSPSSRLVPTATVPSSSTPV